MIHLVYTDAAKRKVAAGACYAAMQHLAVTVLKYYVDEPVMAARILIDPETHRYQRMMPDTQADDRDTYLTYISRCDNT
jgi:hypothetical protein